MDFDINALEIFLCNDKRRHKFLYSFKQKSKVSSNSEQELKVIEYSQIKHVLQPSATYFPSLDTSSSFCLVS